MMHPSVVVLASIIGLAVAQSLSECTDFEAARDCVLPLANQGITCQTAREIKKCYKDYCPEVSVPSELNSAIDICENGGTIPGSGSGTGSETGTPTDSGSQSTSTSGTGSGSGGSSGGTCIDRQAYSDCVNPLARKEQTCDVILEIAECFANYCPDRAYQIEEDVSACSASGSGSGSTRTSSADDSESTDSNSGIPGGGSGSTRTTSGADSTGTGIGSGFGGNSTIADPSNTSSNGDGPASTDGADNEGAADRLFAPVGAIIGSLVAVMAWL